MDEGVDKQEDPTRVTGNEEPLPTVTDSVGEGGYEECRIPASDAMWEEAPESKIQSSAEGFCMALRAAISAEVFHCCSLEESVVDIYAGVNVV